MILAEKPCRRLRNSLVKIERAGSMCGYIYTIASLRFSAERERESLLYR